MKNCINFIRCHEICRVWEVSLSHYPSQRLRASLVKKSQLQKKVFLLYERCEFTSLNWTAQGMVSKRKNHCVVSKSNLINCGLTCRHSTVQKRERTGTSFLHWLDWKSKHFNSNVTEWKATRSSLRVFSGVLQKLQNSIQTLTILWPVYPIHTNSLF